MQLHSENNQLVTNLQSKAQAFTIHASPKAFKVLSNNMYKDKIAAIIRELSCNALDSHIDAGNPDPFVVHLPSTFEPYFAVEDFGTGMTPEQIADLYTGYFASSKSQRNDQIGALGLGSKSPFAYTDMFTIDSVKDGIKATYSAFVNPEGFPTYLPVKSEPSSQHNGVRITFPVPEVDFREFAEKAARIFWAFDRKPIVTGSVRAYNEYLRDDQSAIVTMSGTGWKFYKRYPDYLNRKFAYEGGALVRMGNILYPIRSLAEEAQFKDVEVFLKNALVIDMPLGSCDIAPSREELSYDQLTKDNILERLIDIRKELEDNFSKQVASAETVWIAAKSVKEFYSSFLGSREEMYNFSFKGKEYKVGQVLSTKVSNLTFTYEQYRGKTTIRKTGNGMPKDTLEVQLGGQYLIVLAGTQDIDSVYLRTRAKLYLQKAQATTTTRNSDVYIKVVRSLTAAQLEELGNPSAVKYEDLPRPQYQAAVKATPKKQVRLYGSYTPVELSSLKGKKFIYIIEHRKQYYIDKDLKDQNNLYCWTKKDNEISRLIHYAFNNNALPESITKKIYIVPLKLFESANLGKKKAWVSLKSVIVRGCNHLYNRNIQIEHDASNAERLISFYKGIFVLQEVFENANLHVDSPMLKALKILITYRSDNSKVQAFDKAKKMINSMETMRRVFKGKLIENVVSKDDNFVDPCQVYVQYPMLKAVMEYSSNRYGFNYASNSFRIDALNQDPREVNQVSILTDVVEYVRMVDAANGLK